jgi:hypothetical protein
VPYGGAFAQLDALRTLIKEVPTDYFGRCASFAYCRNYIDEHRLSAVMWQSFSMPRNVTPRNISRLEQLHCHECALERAVRNREGKRGVLPQWAQLIRDVVIRSPERARDIFKPEPPADRLPRRSLREWLRNDREMSAEAKRIHKQQWSGPAS